MYKSVVWNLECVFPWERYRKWRLGSQAGGWKLIYPTMLFSEITQSDFPDQDSERWEPCATDPLWGAGPALGQGGLLVCALVWFRQGLNFKKHKVSFNCI